jgi:hypothetical protein
MFQPPPFTPKSSTSVISTIEDGSAVELFPSSTSRQVVQDTFQIASARINNIGSLRGASESMSDRDNDHHTNSNSEQIIFFPSHDDEENNIDDPLNTPLLLEFNNRPRQQRLRHEKPTLNGLNYLNFVSYLLHLFVSWGIGVWGLDGLIDTRWAVAQKYETLVNPALWTYWAMWYPILILEGVFAVAQMFPYFRARPIVQSGTGFFFFYCFIIQTAWTIFWAFHLFVASFIAVVAALLTLMQLLYSQQQQVLSERAQNQALTDGFSGVRLSRREKLEYYLFRFPFHLHTGWMFAVTVHHFSLMFRSYNAPVSVQLSVDIVCLGLLLPVAIFFLTSSWIKDFVIPLVILISYIGIAWRLEHYSETMLDLFGLEEIESLKYSCYFFAGFVGICLAPNVVIWLAREFCTITVVEVND